MDEWQPFGYDVQYCLSEKVPQQCSYSGNVPIVAVVFVCNVVKFAIMLFVGLRLKDSRLITVGDAVQSFLDHNDKSTRGLCLLSRKDVVHAVRRKQHWAIQDEERCNEQMTGKLARRENHRWAESASGWRWSLTLAFSWSHW